MDFIWVPGVPETSQGGGSGNSSLPISNEQKLFLVGFIILALCAFAGSLLIDGTIAKTASKFGMDWVVQAVVFFPMFGFLLQNFGALIGVLKSKASIEKRLAWFVTSQAVACVLWWASSLH